MTNELRRLRVGRRLRIGWKEVQIAAEMMSTCGQVHLRQGMNKSWSISPNEALQ